MTRITFRKSKSARRSDFKLLHRRLTVALIILGVAVELVEQVRRLIEVDEEERQQPPEHQRNHWKGGERTRGKRCVADSDMERYRYRRSPGDDPWYEQEQWE